VSHGHKPGLLARAADTLSTHAVRGTKRLVRPLWMQRLEAANRDSRESLVAPGGPVVSLTTYGARWRRVHYTIESIGCGRLRPSRLVLWVSPALIDSGIHPELQRQQSRGLEIRACTDLGPHTKYYPLVESGAVDMPAVTADDDILYRADWLEVLVRIAARHPEGIHAYRAHEMLFEPDGRLRSYTQWRACRSTAPSPLHFLTGVAGVYYPPAMLRALQAAGDAFRATCPRNDDIWLNVTAWRHGIAVRQARSFWPVLFELPGSRREGLALGNVRGGGNDQQMAATLNEADLALLRAAAGFR
jgi:hypothetical protein